MKIAEWGWLFHFIVMMHMTMVLVASNFFRHIVGSFSISIFA